MISISKKWLALPLVCSISLLSACSSSMLTVPAISQSAQKTPGQVVWRDLITTEPKQVQGFYQAVFDWSFEPINDYYSLIKYQRNYIAGMASAPIGDDTNYWLPVMSTLDVDATVQLAKAAGAKVLVGKTTLNGRGDIAVIQDPQGAVFSVLDTVAGDPEISVKSAGNWVWQEVWTQDPKQSQQFYQKLGKYELASKELADNQYQYLTLSNQPAFGLVKKPNDEVATIWVNYIKVEDVNATLAKVVANGGSVLMAPNDAVRASSVAIVRDPAGAGFVIQEIK